MLQYFWRSISILPHLKHTFSSSEWGVAPYSRAFVWVNDFGIQFAQGQSVRRNNKHFLWKQSHSGKEHFQRKGDYQGSRMGLFMGKIAFWEECGVYSVVD